MLQKYNVEEDPTDPAPPPLSSSLSLFSRLQLELEELELELDELELDLDELEVELEELEGSSLLG
jgi:chaperonin cofactor prefoldin